MAITKPILYNGFEIKRNIKIQKRIEKIFFTEVYLLSNDKYFYLFTNLRLDDLVKSSKHEIIIVESNGKEYISVMNDEYSNKQVTSIIEDLTTLHGLDSVAGMNKLKTLLIEEVMEPLQNPDKFKKFKLSIPNGILLYGPPGCGKTFIIKKLAEELGYNFVEMNPSSVATQYVHGAVGNIGKVFEMARLKAPSIIFIDEIEGLVPRRDALSSSADIKKEEINEFLLQLNNAGDNKILVVGATNQPELIDSAILRSGRMDKRIYVAPPDEQARKEMFIIFLSGRPYKKDIDFNKLSDITEGYVGSDIELIVTQAARLAVTRNEDEINDKMLLESIKTVTPSISKGDIQYYNKFSSMERW